MVQYVVMPTHFSRDHPEVVRILRGFRVFDISHCDCPPCPKIWPELLTARAPRP
jgi:hypothetical protein